MSGYRKKSSSTRPQKFGLNLAEFVFLYSLYVGYITWDTLIQIWELAVSLGKRDIFNRNQFFCSFRSETFSTGVLCLEIFKLTGVVESPTMASLSVISLDKKKIHTLLEKNRFGFPRFVHSGFVPDRTDIKGPGQVIVSKPL